MNEMKHSQGDINTHGGGINPPCIGLTSNALPEVQMLVMAEDSQTGVSTRNVLLRNDSLKEKNHTNHDSHWYALRTTYGREKKASDYLNSKGVLVYCPTLSIVKIINGKRKSLVESRIPNIFFAFGTEEEIKSYVYDNVNLPYLRFYYRHFHVGNNAEKEPLIVPTNQIESLRIICAADAEDVIVTTSDIPKFSKGQLVKIIAGRFEGVIGKVARYQGQQRVAVVIDGLLAIATAYIPSSFIEKI